MKQNNFTRTDYETEQLHKALLKETRRCAVTLGMKKTSVDQLTKAVGIAKGSFYKFYESKEMAFFAVLESIHSELYGVADQALHRNGGLPTSERGRGASLAAATVRRLILTVSHKEQIGELYPQVLEALVSALAGSYLNKQKGRRNAAFPKHVD